MRQIAIKIFDKKNNKYCFALILKLFFQIMLIFNKTLTKLYTYMNISLFRISYSRFKIKVFDVAVSEFHVFS